ncbi:MAG: hypothetical protein RLZZ60_551 [Bacteroidota bacterium]|jgi:lipopolysaccharide transport system ATP-binding protein
MSSPIISVNHISKQYRLGNIGASTLAADFNRLLGNFFARKQPSKKDLIWALNDINFSVQQGEVLGIIGKNGAGKSTLLKILSRVTSPTSGDIVINGRMASLLEVGTGFHPELTGRENVFLNGAIMGMTKSEIRRKFDEIVDFSGVEKYIDTPVKRYSSGMYVRLAFAVAAHLEPEILIVDEVLAVGDAEFQKKCLGKMKSVSNQGRTVLFVSHNMSAIQSLCPRSILLKSGELIKDGATEQIIQYYLGNELTTSNEIIFDAQNELNYVKSLKLTHQDSSVGRAYKCGETLSFDFEIEADSAGDYQLGIGVASALDVNIFSELSEPIALHKGTQTIHYTNQQIKLAPGHYALTFNWLRNGKSIQYEEKILHFEVLELTTQDETYSIGKGAGFIVSKGLFKLK